MLEPWRVVGSRVTYEDRWLKVRTDRCVDGRGRTIESYHVLEYPTWINVVAVTEARELVMAREYRHGLGAIVAGLPCGAMERDDLGIEAAARRELAEETGFGGGTFHPLGSHHANPANQPNASISALLLGVKPVGRPKLDPGEEIEVLLEAFVPFLARAWRGEVPLQVSHALALHLAGLAMAAPGSPDWADVRAAVRAEFSRLIQHPLPA